MYDDFFTGLQAIFHHRLQPATAAQLHRSPGSLAVDRSEHRPLLPVTKQRADRHFDYLVEARHDNARIHFVSVAERVLFFSGRDEVDHHVDALLLNAQGGNLGKGCRLHRSQRLS